jgi:hypothetical protein
LDYFSVLPVLPVLSVLSVDKALAEVGVPERRCPS